jgi:peptide/nickel transport system substrate-binding protein
MFSAQKDIPMNPNKRFAALASFLLALLLFITACGLPFSTAAEPEVTAIPSATSAPLPTATPAPKILTICLGQEPNTLYPFGGPNAAARSVLAAINDGPIDTAGYEYQPVILTQLPTLENGDAQIVRTPIQSGSQVVDADGAVVLLEKDVRIRPAGCRADDCVITYDGTTPIEMDQMIVNFRMRPDLTWSDGTPVTADDSVYAFTVAGDPKSVADTFLLDRTQTYEAADANTIQWWGKPGFIDPSYFANFWQPMPKHLWSQFSADQLPTIDVSSRAPAGWGPYMIQEWAAGDRITLAKNPYYFRAKDGYPKFDSLTFRFVADPEAALTELVAGRCDILDPSIRLDNEASLLTEMEKGGQAQVFFAPGMTIEWLGLGSTPAAYDDGYDTLYQKDRPDIFADPRTRQGIAFCLDRQSVVTNVLLGRSTVPATYLPVEHPLYDPNIAPVPFDPTSGMSLLDQAGWKDTDGDPATPLVAVAVQNVPAGTPLLLNYYTTSATQRRQAADILAKSLAQCEVGVNAQFLSQTELYAPGPDGPLFGRRFDLVQYAMGVNGVEPPCGWFTSAEIPSASNGWIGTNVAGYKNDEYDTACRAAKLALPGEQAYIDSYRATQTIFASGIPAIPLYYRLRVSVARPGICHYNFDATANPLWNIEAMDSGEACQN